MRFRINGSALRVQLKQVFDKAVEKVGELDSSELSDDDKLNAAVAAIASEVDDLIDWGFVKNPILRAFCEAVDGLLAEMIVELAIDAIRHQAE